MTYHPTTCDAYFDEARVAPTNLDAELARLIPMVSVIDGMPPTPHGLERVRRALQALLDEARQMPVAEDVECGYDGPVDADYQRLSATSGVVRWTCPRCGNDREDFREKGDED